MRRPFRQGSRDLDRASFKHALASVPDVGSDDEFVFARPAHLRRVH